LSLETPHRHGSLDIQGCGVRVSLVAATPMQPDAAKEMVGRLVSEIASESISRGALAIGHVKAILMAGNESVRADTIGIKYGARTAGGIGSPLSRATLTVNSIIVGLHADVIEALTLGAIRGQLESQGVEVVVEESALHEGGAESRQCHAHTDETGAPRFRRRRQGLKRLKHGWSEARS